MDKQSEQEELTRTCNSCGGVTLFVRPGKYQCEKCESNVCYMCNTPLGERRFGSHGQFCSKSCHADYAGVEGE